MQAFSPTPTDRTPHPHRFLPSGGRKRYLRGVRWIQALSRPASFALIRSAQGIVLQQSPPDDHPLDVSRAFTNEQHRRLAIEPLDLVLLGVSVATVDAEGVRH